MMATKRRPAPRIEGGNYLSRMQRLVVLPAYYLFLAMPYPLRKVATALYIAFALLGRKLTGVERYHQPTPTDKLYSLGFWGVPAVDVAAYTLTVDGAVRRPLRLSFGELLEMADVERAVTLDCVGGSRNNCSMRGVSLRSLLALAQPAEEAATVVFHCADGYYTTHPLSVLAERDAFVAYEVNGQRLPRLGYPLRLAVPGKYGYKWAKWVERIELVADDRKGYWESRGLPHRADIGDIW
ncbi:MAG: molybdopterin-dependent oxidoreductase [Dehalococcoidia bacterium]